MIEVNRCSGFCLANQQYKHRPTSVVVFFVYLKDTAFSRILMKIQTTISLCIQSSTQNRTLRSVFYDFAGGYFTMKQQQTSRVSDVSTSRDVIETGGRKNFEAL